MARSCQRLCDRYSCRWDGASTKSRAKPLNAADQIGVAAKALLHLRQVKSGSRLPAGAELKRHQVPSTGIAFHRAACHQWACSGAHSCPQLQWPRGLPCGPEQVSAITGRLCRGGCWRMARVACMPSILGMCTSISTRSKDCLSSTFSACSPSVASST